MLAADVGAKRINATGCVDDVAYDLRIERATGEVWARAINECVVGRGDSTVTEELWGACRKMPLRPATRTNAF